MKKNHWSIDMCNDYNKVTTRLRFRSRSWVNRSSYGVEKRRIFTRDGDVFFFSSHCYITRRYCCKPTRKVMGNATATVQRTLPAKRKKIQSLTMYTYQININNIMILEVYRLPVNVWDFDRLAHFTLYNLHSKIIAAQSS